MSGYARKYPRGRKKLSARFSRGAAAAAAVAALVSTPSFANDVTWQGGVGNWTDPNWSPAAPIATDNVFIDGGNPFNSIVSLNTNATVNDLNISVGDTLDIQNSRSLLVTGNLINLGSVELNSSGSITSLQIGPSTTFSGTGTVTLGNNTSNRILGQSSTDVLTNTVDHTIQGSGALGAGFMGLINEGLIDANQSVPLTVNLSTSGDVSKINTGILQASDGGSLTITNSGTITNTSGTIAALDNSTVNISNTRIIGGELTSDGTGVVNVGASGTTTLESLLNTADLQIANSNLAVVVGTITNEGTISLNSTASITQLRIDGEVTLAGDGTVTLGDNGNNRVAGQGSTDILTNTANHTIQGGGALGNNFMGLINEGLIDANQDTALTVNLSVGAGGSRINTGTLQASDGGTLTIISSDTLTNTGGTIAALDNSTVNINNTHIIGGELTSNGTGVVNLSGEARLDSLLNTADVHLTNSSSALLAGTVTNEGMISLNSAGSVTLLRIDGDVTLAGDGTVTLGNHANNRFHGAASTNVLTNTANHTIQGSGDLGRNLMGLINEGLVDANQSEMLTINLNTSEGVSRVNTGTLQASDGGFLLITSSGTLTNTGGIIAARDGSTVSIINNTRIIGGEVTSEGSGIVNFGSTAILDSLLNTADVHITTGNTGLLAGTVTNEGTINLSSTGTITQLRIEGDVTLAGDGAVTLGNHANQRISGQASSDVLTNTANHTIQGSGDFGNNLMGLINEGLIDANQSIALTVNLNTAEGVSRVNTGTMQASNGGTLNIASSDTIINTGGTIAALDGSTVNLTNTRITGGELTSSGSGVVNFGGSATLDSLLNTADVHIANSATGFLAGTVTNDGMISVNSAGSTTQLRIDGDVTLAGNGTVTLGDHGNNRMTGLASSDLLINAAGHTIQGSGALGNNQMRLTNHGLIEATGTIALTIDPSGVGSMTNSASGILRGSGSGGLVLNNGHFANLGTIEALNGSSVTFTTSAASGNAGVTGQLTGGTWRSISTGDGAIIGIRSPAGEVNTTGAGTEIVLSGAGSDFRVLGSGASFTSLESTLNNNMGTLRVLDNRDFNASNALVNSGMIQLGGGTLDTPALTNTATGILTGYGTVTPRPTNAGLIEATGGTLVMSGGIQGGSGTVSVAPGGALDLSGASMASSADYLDHQGTTAGSLNLGSNDFIVSVDYTNANFGTGNSFDARANVAGTGQIIGENAAMAVSGDVTPAGANTVALDLGNVRGGTSATVDYQIANTGTGADIRGAVQTAAGGGNVTDSRLSGSGVTADNFGPIAAGDDSGNLSVTFDATTGGSLSGQSIAIVSNFDNVAPQMIEISGMATALAQGSATPAPGPVDLGNFRVGVDGVSQDFAVANTTDGAGAEQLGIGSATTTGNFAATNNLGGGLIAGGTSQAAAITAAVNSGVAGVNTGSLDIQYTTDGTAIDASFTAINSNDESISLSATGFNVAQGATTPDPVVIANQRVGGSESQSLTISNIAPDGAFTEGLNANFGAVTGDVTTNAGSVSLLAGGASNSTAMSVGIDTGSAGAQSGNVTVNYVSDGDGTSGLGTLDVGSQTINVSGNVYQIAEAQLNTSPLNFGTVQVGQSVSQNLSISNVATGPAGFVEDLNANFGTTSGTGAGQIIGTGSISGLIAGQTDASAMNVSVNTTAAGSINGAIEVNYFSAGAVNGVSNGLGTLAIGSDSFGVTGVIEMAGQVIDAAAPVINTAQPINLGNVRVGDVSPTTAISVTNQATGNDQAALNATITGNPPITATGSFALLGPGGTDATSLQVGMNTGAAGAVNGTATVSFVSDASNVGGCEPNCQMNLAPQDVQITGAVYQIAQPDVPTDINVGNFRLGTNASQALAITNTDISPAGYQEGLDVAAAGTTGVATVAGGPVSNLAAGGTSNAISVGIDGGAAVAGANTGNVMLNLASNGDGTSGLGTLALADATVSVTGTGYRLASPDLDTSDVSLYARRGDAAPTASVGVTNQSPDAFTEGLNAAFGAVDPAFSGSGAINNLVAGGSDASSLSIALDTSVAGNFSGNAQLDYVSTGAGTTGAADVSVGSDTVGLQGRVYEAAVAQVNTTTIDFGIVHVGEMVAASNVSVTNAAPIAGLNDTLAGQFVNLPAGAFNGAGAVSGLAAGATDTSSLQVSLDTSVSGQFISSGQYLQFASQNPDMTDLGLGLSALTMQAQVNQFANPTFLQTGGAGTTTGSGFAFQHDFGTLVAGGSMVSASLGVLNDVIGFADFLGGSFQLNAASPFSLSGFDSFLGLAAGDIFGGLSIGFDPLAYGSFSDTIVLNAFGTNASGYFGAFDQITLTILANVTDISVPVSAPGPLPLMLLGLAAFAAFRQRRHVRGRSHERT